VIPSTVTVAAFPAVASSEIQPAAVLRGPPPAVLSRSMRNWADAVALAATDAAARRKMKPRFRIVEGF
jgi:hypothetical protein